MAVIVYDNFGQRLEDLDLVVVAAQENSINICKMGIYFNTFLFILAQGATADKGVVDMKRYAMFKHDENERPVNRILVEMGEEQGELILKGCIKQGDLTEDMLIMRAMLIDKIQKGKLKSNVNRSITNDLLRVAQEQGRI